MKIIGHRGAAGEAFENSFSAFSRAYDLKLELFEVDIQITRDGVPVIFHDEELSRCTNMNGTISQYDYQFINDNVLLKNGEKIPSLQELCILNENRPQTIILEIKKPSLSRIVLETIERFNPQQYIVSSFFHRTILQIKEMNPSIKTAAIFECFPVDIREFILSTKCDSVAFGIETCDYEMINQIKEIQKECFAWTVNTEFEFQHSSQLNIDGIITNYPSAFLPRMS